MKKIGLKHSLVAAFALAGAMVLSPVSQALAGDTSVALGNGGIMATMEGGGTKVQMDGKGNVEIFVNGGGSVTVHTNDGITIGPAADATAKAGNKLADGTIYAGNGFSATPADAPDLYEWAESKRYCEDLIANGHDDWALPTKDQLNKLYQNRNIGSFAGTFKEPGSSKADFWYWSSMEYPEEPYNDRAWAQYFANGFQTEVWKDVQASVRCVRSPAPLRERRGVSQLLIKD